MNKLKAVPVIVTFLWWKHLLNNPEKNEPYINKIKILNKWDEAKFRVAYDFFILYVKSYILHFDGYIW